MIEGMSSVSEHHESGLLKKELASAKASQKELAKSNEALRDQLQRDDRLLERLNESITALPPFKEKPLPKFDANKGILEANLNLADLHGEETVDPMETEGLAAFCWDDFLGRMWETTTATIKIVEAVRQAYNCKDLTIHMLGDMITGEIHEDAKLSNTFDTPTAVAQVGYIVGQSVQLLAPHFDNVKCACIVGNHGRTDKKPPSKKQAVRNWDYLIYVIASMMTKDIKNVTWEIPKSAMHISKILDNRILIQHGDQISGGGTHPYYPLARDTARQADARRGTEQDFDYIMQGHLHHLGIIEDKRILCPSLKGADQYTLKKFTNSHPAQLLCFWDEHGRRPISWPIDLRKTGHDHGYKIAEWF